IGLPDPPGTRTEVEDGRVDRISSHRHHAPPTRRTNAPPLHSVEESGIFVEYGLRHIGTFPTVADHKSHRHHGTARRLFSHRAFSLATARRWGGATGGRDGTADEPAGKHNTKAV